MPPPIDFTKVTVHLTTYRYQLSSAHLTHAQRFRVAPGVRRRRGQCCANQASMLK